MPASNLPNVHVIAQLIDHALLLPQMRESDFLDGLDEAAHRQVFSVCVPPSRVAQAVGWLTDSGVRVGTVVGFPHGSTTTAVKVAEATEAIANGASEVDMVMNIAWLRSRHFAAVRQDMAAVVEVVKALKQDAIVKVILETAYLTPEEIADASSLVEDAGADFVKTSTGFAGEGATIDNLRIMRASVSPHVQVKASGGVRDLDTLLAMRAIGVTRFGTSNTGAILDDLASRLATGQAKTATGTATY